MDKKIYRMDGMRFLSLIGSSSVDLVLTDPPYQISRDSGMQSALETQSGLEKFRIQTKFGKWDEDFDIEQLKGYFSEFKRILRPGGTIICFYDIWKVTPLADLIKSEGLKQIRLIEWIKTNPVPINSKTNYLTNSREIAVTCIKGSKPTFNSQYDNGIYHYPIYQGQRGERCHPTQKSLPLFQELIKKHSSPGDTVVDPFLGSGTSALAAMLEDRGFLGSEISVEYFENCKKRFENFYPNLKPDFISSTPTFSQTLDQQRAG